MRALAVIQVQISADQGACFYDVVVGSQIDLFEFNRVPYPLDENIVVPRPLPSMRMAIAFSNTPLRPPRPPIGDLVWMDVDLLCQPG